MALTFLGLMNYFQSEPVPLSTTPLPETFALSVDFLKIASAVGDCSGGHPEHTHGSCSAERGLLFLLKVAL
jgi:hypothetical protein